MALNVKINETKKSIAFASLRYWLTYFSEGFKKKHTKFRVKQSNNNVLKKRENLHFHFFPSYEICISDRAIALINVESNHVNTHIHKLLNI